MENIIYNKPKEDFESIKFGDKRLDKRLCKTVNWMTQNAQESILSGCGKRHDAKAFYALLSNDKFSMEQLVEKARQATQERIRESNITRVLLVQDTTDINLNGHKKTKDLGYCSEHIRGIKLHSCLALTAEGIPLGLVSQQYDTRKTPKQKLSHEEKAKRPIEEKESFRWLETARETLELIPDGVTPVLLCDREGDFYELYAEMLRLGTSFVVRLTHDRATTDGEHCIRQLRRTKAVGEVEVCIPRDTRNNIPQRTARMEVASCAVSVKRPKRVPSDLPGFLTLQLVRVTEIGESDAPIEWLLATNLPLAGASDAMGVVEDYVQRWKIERFHYVLKSGCMVERIGQRTYQRILPVLLIFSVIAVFLLSMTYLSRTLPTIGCDAFLEENEWKILYRLVTGKKDVPEKPYPLETAVRYLGELGSYRHAKSDGEYGVKAIWKGLFQLFDAMEVVERLM